MYSVIAMLAKTIGPQRFSQIQPNGKCSKVHVTLNIHPYLSTNQGDIFHNTEWTFKITQSSIKRQK